MNGDKTLCALLLATAIISGCGGGSPGASAQAQPTGTLSSPATTSPAAPLESDTALSLFESGWLQSSLTVSALWYATVNYSLWTTSACIFGSGSLLASLDGAPATAGPLPAGSHTFQVTFNDCQVDGLAGIHLNGTASAMYESADMRDITATVSSPSMRGTGLALRSDLRDVTATGSGQWRQVTTDSGLPTTTYTPTPGSTLANNLTGHVATFLGGSYTSGQSPPPLGSSASVQQEFASLTVLIGGTEYVLDGNLQSVYGFVGNQGRHTGEVRITSGGALVARVYGDATGEFRIDVLQAMQPF
jgi:hypothetical protein